ncbi:hypothetical protein D3C71_1116850 [compost metagenome]
MTGNHGAQRIHIGLIVEQRTAAAVDLGVDEARHQPATAQIHLLIGSSNRRIIRSHDRNDAVVLDHDGNVVTEVLADKNAAIAQYGFHQTVSVTLFRCGGRSGLLPRRSASALIAR